MPNQSAAHHKLVADTRKALGREPDLTLYLNSKGRWDAGAFKSNPGLGTGTYDLVGMLTVEVAVYDHDDTRPQPIARFIALEAKTGKATESKEQVLFGELVRRRGGFAAVFHSVKEAVACIERARRGESA